MTKEQRALLETAVNFIAAIEKMTAAIHYAADTIGFEADSVVKSPVEEETVETDTPAPVEEEEAVAAEISDDDLRAELNAYAKVAGKKATLGLVAKYAESMTPVDINQEDRIKVIDTIDQYDR